MCVRHTFPGASHTRRGGEIRGGDKRRFIREEEWLGRGGRRTRREEKKKRGKREQKGCEHTKIILKWHTKTLLNGLFFFFIRGPPLVVFVGPHLPHPRRGLPPYGVVSSRVELHVLALAKHASPAAPRPSAAGDPRQGGFD